MKGTRLKPVATGNEYSLKTLVENRTAYTLEKCELNVFETHQFSERVPLTFHDFVVTSMLRGKKIMHLNGQDAFDYLPGETVLVPGGETMHIDFPEAERSNPTQCIALAIDHHKIDTTLQLLNERYPREGNRYWHFYRNNYHFPNSEEIAILLNKIIGLCSSDHMTKDILADLSLQELIVHIIQAQHRMQAEELTAGTPQANPLYYITAFIKANITQEIRLGVLSEKAYMSKATFYRSFKREFGISPQEFIINEKIKHAKELLRQRRFSIKQVAFECGFNDVNYFIRLFKKAEGITPGQYELVLAKLIQQAS